MKKPMLLLLSLFLISAILLNTNQASAQPSHPNILFILLDDARYDMFQPNGGPAYFNTPSINRIANEGINFRYTFATTSLCTPSRASFNTGLYSHHHGAYNNFSSPNPDLAFIGDILQDAGYFTGFIGKWNNLVDTPIGFNYWACTQDGAHNDPIFTFNDGSVIQYLGFDAEVYTDISIDFLENKVPDGQPWVLFLFHRVPHGSYDVMPGEDSLYQHASISFPANFTHYTKNYPSYLYSSGNHEYDGDSVQLDQDIRDYYETCHAAEHSVESMLSYLDAHGITDSTMIIFSSDNGYMFGEHHLTEKNLAYEESIRLPLFIRYPLWFTAGTVVTDEFAANIDIAPTLLELAGIPDTFHMDGISLKKLAAGEVHRQNFFYEFYPPGKKSWEAIRSFQYKYIYGYCADTTEEFFDLMADPHENINLIFDPAYASTITQFRLRRDSFRLATNDIIYPPLENCSLKSTFYKDEDEDGFGDPLITKSNKDMPSGYVENADDCNDQSADIHPGVDDLCNSIDDNCDGVIDEHAIAASIIPDGNQSICSGASLALTANSGEGISYQWVKNNKNISGATDQIYSAKKAADYSVTETNSFNCSSTSLPVTITVIISPDAAVTPLGNPDICSAGYVDLLANGDVGFTYQWKRGSSDIAGATNQTYTAKGFYKVVVTSNGCSKTSAKVQITNSCREDPEDMNIFFQSASIFPNPADGSFVIDLERGNSEGDIVGIQIINMLGKEVYNEVVVREGNRLLKKIKLDDSIADGMYFIVISAGDKIYTQQLVLQR